MRIKLLFADDSMTMQKVIRLTLENEDVELQLASDGRQALELAQKFSPDIVVADISMPEMDGFELCRSLKGSPNGPSIPVILISGELERYDAKKGEEAGADAHITKPFKSKEFVDTVFNMVEAFKSASIGNQSPNPSPENFEPAELDNSGILKLSPQKNAAPQRAKDGTAEELEIIDESPDLYDDLDEDMADDPELENIVGSGESGADPIEKISQAIFGVDAGAGDEKDSLNSDESDRELAEFITGSISGPPLRDRAEKDEKSPEDTYVDPIAPGLKNDDPLGNNPLGSQSGQEKEGFKKPAEITPVDDFVEEAEKEAEKMPASEEGKTEPLSEPELNDGSSQANGALSDPDIETNQPKNTEVSGMEDDELADLDISDDDLQKTDLSEDDAFEADAESKVDLGRMELDETFGGTAQMISSVLEDIGEEPELDEETDKKLPSPESSPESSVGESSIGGTTQMINSVLDEIGTKPDLQPEPEKSGPDKPSNEPDTTGSEALTAPSEEEEEPIARLDRTGDLDVSDADLTDASDDGSENEVIEENGEELLQIPDEEPDEPEEEPIARLDRTGDLDVSDADLTDASDDGSENEVIEEGAEELLQIPDEEPDEAEEEQVSEEVEEEVIGKLDRTTELDDSHRNIPEQVSEAAEEEVIGKLDRTTELDDSRRNIPEQVAEEVEEEAIGKLDRTTELDDSRRNIPEQVAEEVEEEAIGKLDRTTELDDSHRNIPWQVSEDGEEEAIGKLDRTTELDDSHRNIPWQVSEDAEEEAAGESDRASALDDTDKISAESAEEHDNSEAEEDLQGTDSASEVDFSETPEAEEVDSESEGVIAPVEAAQEVLAEVEEEAEPEAEPARHMEAVPDPSVVKEAVNSSIKEFMEKEGRATIQAAIADAIGENLKELLEDRLNESLKEEISKQVGESLKQVIPELVNAVKTITSEITPGIAEEMIKNAIEQIKKEE